MFIAATVFVTVTVVMALVVAMIWTMVATVVVDPFDKTTVSTKSARVAQPA